MIEYIMGKLSAGRYERIFIMLKWVTCHTSRSPLVAGLVPDVLGRFWFLSF